MKTLISTLLVDGVVIADRLDVISGNNNFKEKTEAMETRHYALK